MGTSTTVAANRMATAGRGSFWHEILGAFSPNRVISKAALRFIIAFQIAVLLVVWATSTYVFLPKPMDVWRAFVDLWTHQGLGDGHFAGACLPHRGSRVPADRAGHFQGSFPRDGGTHVLFHYHFFQRTPAESKLVSFWCGGFFCDQHDRRGRANRQRKV